MNINITRILVIVLCLFSYCSERMHSRQGVYLSKGSDVIHRLVITDTAFTYHITGGHHEAFSTGHYKIDNGKITLNSYPNFKKGQCLVIPDSLSALKEDSLRLLIYDSAFNPLLYSSVLYNGSIKSVDRNGYIAFRSGIDSVFEVLFLSEKYSCIVKDNTRSRTQVVKLKLNNNSEIYFDNEIGNFKGGRLYFGNLTFLRQ
jgi:hypothetical protein